MHVYYMNVYIYELQFTYFYRFFVHCKTVLNFKISLGINIITSGFIAFVLPDASKPNYYGVKSFEVY